MGFGDCLEFTGQDSLPRGGRQPREPRVHVGWRAAVVVAGPVPGEFVIGGLDGIR